ncbi:SDR family oxidoreductase [Marinobacterium sp. YM272]|uniref:SDR family oxidoreductase n=1 Tax=Marinobacterium sp. YM272 TaxID=3421654 RepID=UPI003D7F73A9
MSKALIVGANGKIGRILVEKLNLQGTPFVAMVRSEEQAERLREKGIEVVVGDLEDPSDELLDGCDQLVFTAGSGAATGVDKTVLVDLWGACKMVDAARRCGIKQFIMVSGRNAGDPDKGAVKMKPYLIAKHFADRHLLESGVPSTILRPGRLLDEPAEGGFSSERPADPQAQVISREDVADLIVHCLQTPATIGRMAEVYRGSRAVDEIVG